MEGGAKGLRRKREELKGSVTEQKENQAKGEQTADSMRLNRCGRDSSWEAEDRIKKQKGRR